jgi:NAD(P)-dependent dehydrogenase (short-subunit alcohol dehydrogenase family)
MGKAIFITGASSGIGKATAFHFHQKGWNVIAAMRSPEKETALADLENVQLARLDVLDLDSIHRAVQDGIDRFGRIDALVNNAGYGAYGPLEVFPRENIVKQFNTNVIGLIDVTRAVIPQFRENNSGVIVNISSIGGQMAFALGALYHGTKFAVEGISESLHYEMAQIGVKVKIIEPGFIATDFGGRSFDFQAGEIEAYQPIVEALMKQWQNPSNTISPPSLVAEVIYGAVTDGSTQLRYRAGDDAEFLLDSRKRMTDEAFFAMMRQQMGK